MGVYYLIKDFKKVETITIDTEYPGKEKLLSSILVTLLETHRKPIHNIYFARIGNHPKVHYTAKDVFDKKKKADTVLLYRDIIRMKKG